jgi:putative transposase
MTDSERAAALAERQVNRRPWHSPPHIDSDSGLYLVTAACFEHQPIIGASSKRMAEFSQSLAVLVESNGRALFAYCVLPNHYHFVARSPDVNVLLRELGRLHGSTSYRWNGDENCRGRKVWFNAVETGIKSERHFWASLVYVWHNPVKHGYVERWQEWPFSNAAEWLDSVSRDEATRIWQEYPIDEYGATWDPPDL